MGKKIDIEARNSPTVKFGNTNIKNHSDNNVTVTNNLNLSLLPSIPETSASSQATFEFQDLLKTISQNEQGASNSGSRATVDGRIEFNVQDCIESFTERTTLLTELQQMIEANRHSSQLTVISQTSVISGMGGVGKTETARKYIQDYKAHYHHMIWIGAETISDIQTSFRRLAKILGIALPNAGSKAADSFIIDKVYSALCKQSTLIVFDIAEGLDSEGTDSGIRSYLPPSVNRGWIPPAILITSRNPKWNPVDKNKSVVELLGLDDEECIELILTQLNNPETEENQKTDKEVKILCEGLPLVVQTVIAFIKQENESADVLGNPAFTMADFISVYEKRKTELLKTRPNESYGNIGRVNDALTLYQEVLSFRSQQYGPESDEALEVHAAIAVTQANLGKLAFERRKYIEENRMRVLGHTNQITIAARADMARVLYQQGKSMEALTLLYELVSVSTSTLGPVGQVTLDIELLLAETLEDLENFEESAIIFSRLVTKFEVKFGCGHFEAWKVKYSLGVSYLNTGRVEEAYEIISDYVRILPQFFSGNHPNVLRAKSLLAYALGMMGKFDEAMKIVQVTQPIVNASLETDIGTFSVFHENVGTMFRDVGKVHEAGSVYRNAITSMDGSYSGNHPEVLHFKSMLRSLHEMTRMTCQQAAPR